MIRRYVRLLALQLRMSAAAGMAYRADFILEGVMAFAWTFLTLLPLWVLFDQRETVAGWDFPSALVVIAYFTAVKAVMESVVSPSAVDLVERIRSGSFDYMLLKPVDAQVMMSGSRLEPWQILDLLFAIGIATYAFIERGTAPAPADIGLGILLFIAGCVAMYALWFALAAVAFWVVRLDNLPFLLGAIFDTARWPVQVFPKLWRFLFTFVIPIAVMTTYPAMALLGEIDATTTLAVLGGSLGMLIVCRLVWRSAIRNYTSASS